MRVSKRLLVGVLAIVAGQRMEAARTKGEPGLPSVPVTRSEVGSLGQKGPLRRPPSEAEAREASIKVREQLGDLQTLKTLSALLPSVSPELLRAALDYLLESGEIEEWGPKDDAATSWYMDADKLNQICEELLEKTTTKGQKLSELQRAVPALKPALVAAAVTFLTEDGKLRIVEGGTKDDPMLADPPRRRSGG